MTCIRG